MISSTADLANLLKDLYAPEQTKDLKDLRYVIYARKSTDDKEKQVRSLPDQVLECEDLAEKRELNIVDIIQESESAKEPGIRPKFKKMIEDIKAGKYDGIIAWHPDRLARNMREAGIIIDLIDKSIIKDLEFVSFPFSNDATGKMVLGISFVLSKQYSDNLSVNVRRGNRRSIEEGKYLSKGKHGYFKDRNQYLRPDGESFSIMKRAWIMRVDGKTIDEIADFLNQMHYSKRFKDSHKKEIFKMTKQVLSKIFKDPFYCGVVQFGSEDPVDIMDIYDFVPMIDVKTFMNINKLDSNKLKANFRAAKANATKANLMRGKIICGYCGKPMISGITAKKAKNGATTRYFYYRCDEEACSFKNKSVRAKTIVSFASDFLEKNKFSMEKLYDFYLEKMKLKIKNDRVSLERIKTGLKTKSANTTKDVPRIKRFLINETDPIIKDEFKQELKLRKQELIDIKKELDKIEDKKSKGKKVILSYQEFLELFNELPKRIGKIRNMDSLDKIIGNIFLNFTLKGQKVLDFQLKMPFKELFEGQNKPKVFSGGRRRT